MQPMKTTAHKPASSPEITQRFKVDDSPVNLPGLIRRF
jgi:hypothetical protein